MDRCDVLIIGGGPAGSSCAWKLCRAGFDVVVADRSRFPRDKVCAGWITPAILHDLELPVDTYRDGRTWQPFHGFRVGMVGGSEACVDHGQPVSFGIRRCEFDDFLLRRSGARLRLGEPLRSLARDGDGWVWNESLRAQTLVGAGGNFCPVARLLRGDASPGSIIAAQEIEFALDAADAKSCAVEPELPELFFAADLQGYGWIVRKGRFVNIGLGRQDSVGFPGHLNAFLLYLDARDKLPAGMPRRLHGHAYRSYGATSEGVVTDGAVLVGDAAGLADPHSGEGIRPAVESGLLAANALIAADGHCDRERFASYADALQQRFGPGTRFAGADLSALLPAGAKQALGRLLLGQEWFARQVVVDRWFLHREQPPLTVN